MNDNQCKVTFQPHGRTVSVLKDTTILEAAASAGLVIDTPCGGAGTCGKCRVLVSQGAGDPTFADQNTFTKNELKMGWRLACQNRITGNLVVSIPQKSLFYGDHQIAQSSTSGNPTEVRPTIRKVYVELSAPTLEDPRPDLLRLEEKTGSFKVDVAMLRHTPPTTQAGRLQGHGGIFGSSTH